MISIIVTVYNVEKYISKTIESILNQTYADIEVVLIDDGSSDNSAKICDYYGEIDSRVKVLHKQNEGLVKARKDGLKASSGEYIGYVDGDDWIEQDMFDKLYNILVLFNVDIAMCGRYEDTGNTHRLVYHGIPEGRYDKEALLEKIYPNMIVNGEFFEWGVFPGVWDKLFRRECLEKYQMAVDDRLTMGEDAACTYPALLNANSIYVLHECLYHYRQTVSSMVKKQENIDLQRMRFNILYNSVNKSFKKYKAIYDLRRQWREYILFLMVPRADILYKGIEEMDYLFPFKNVKKGSNIVLYGMGTYGQLLYRFIKRTGFCKVVLCVDNNYEELSRQGLLVVSADEIDNYDYDAIVVANSFAKTRKEIYTDLANRFDIEKINVMDVELINSNESLKAFGLIEPEQ